MTEAADPAPTLGSPRRDLALATWGLFVGLTFLMLAAGLFGTVLGVRAERAGLPTAVSSLLSASYYAGFLIGSKIALATLARVGHIRVFAALASLLSAAMMLTGLVDSPAAWIPLRLVTGLCFAGQYVVAESWLNDLANNSNRGRLLGVYMVITTAGYAVGQMLFFSVDDRVITGFAVAGVLTSLAIAPVALSESAVAPAIDASKEHLSLRELAAKVPTGVGMSFLVGLAHGGLTGLIAVYSVRVGLSPARIGLFVAAPQIGGLLLQLPISAASDDIDRRAVGVASSLGAAGCAALLLLGPATSPMAMILIGILGGLSYPLYSIAASYTNDWIEPEHVNAAASQLVTLYGLGAVAGPLVTAASMIVFGPEGFYISALALHLIIGAFLFYRLLAWREPLAKRPWDEVSLPARTFFIPATIVAISRNRFRERKSP